MNKCVEENERKMCAHASARLRKSLSFISKLNAFHFFFSAGAAAATAAAFTTLAVVTFLLPQFCSFSLFDFDYLFVQ